MKIQTMLALTDLSATSASGLEQGERPYHCRSTALGRVEPRQHEGLEHGELPAVHGRRGPGSSRPPSMPTRYAPGMRGEERR